MLNTLAALSAALMSQDFSDLTIRYPGWSGMFSTLDEINWLLLMVVLTLFSAVITIIISLLSTETIEKLKTRVTQHQGELNEVGNSIIMLFDGLLVNLAKRLKLEQESQARLSLYIHDADRNVFVACGRYSPNPIYAAPGRTTYPDHEGCIALGWERGWHFDGAVPTSRVARRNHNTKHYSMSESTSDAIRMSSSLYAVSRLQNAHEKPVAVLVFEAVDPDGYKEEYLRQTLEAVSKDYSRVIETLLDYVPNPARAEEAGL